MVEFTYNNTKNANTGHTLFKFNCGYYFRILFKEDIYSHLRSRFADKLVEELKELIEICYQNLLYT